MSQQKDDTEHLTIGFATSDDFTVKFDSSDSGLAFRLLDSTRNNWIHWCIVITDNGSNSHRGIYTGQNGCSSYWNGYNGCSYSWSSGGFYKESTHASRYGGSGDIRLGYGRTNTFGSDNLVDDFHLFTRALSLSEISTLRDDGDVARTGLAVLYRFHVQEAWDWTQYAQEDHEFAVSTTVLTDESGQDNHASVIGSSWKLKVLPDASIVLF